MKNLADILEYLEFFVIGRSPLIIVAYVALILLSLSGCGAFYFVAGTECTSPHQHDPICDWR